MSVTMALALGFTRSICLRCSSRASRADSFLARIIAAMSTADVKQSEGAEFWALSAAGKAEAAETAASPARNSRRVGWSCFAENMQELYHSRTRRDKHGAICHRCLPSDPRRWRAPAILDCAYKSECDTICLNASPQKAGCARVVSRPFGLECSEFRRGSGL